MKDVVKNNIFLTSEMVVSMSKEFGVPFTAEDFEGEYNQFLDQVVYI